MKIPLLVIVALFMSTTKPIPLQAQEGLSDGERIAKLEAVVNDHLATEADLERFKGELSSEIDKVNRELSANLSEAKEELSGELKGVTATIAALQWVVGTAIAASAVIASLLNIGLTVWTNRNRRVTR